MKEIAKAIINVMKTVKGMEKNSRVGSGSNAYDGTKDQDVKEVMNDAMAANGLCILPIDVQGKITISRWEEEDPYSKSTPKAMKSKQSVFTEVTTKYTLLHESGESIDLGGYGHGTDTQDKGAGKATTYALKNTLLAMFLTPVGKIDDTDKTHSDDMPVPKAQPKPNKVLEDANVQALIDHTIKNKGTIVDIERIFSITPIQKATIVKALKDVK